MSSRSGNEKGMHPDPAVAERLNTQTERSMSASTEQQLMTGNYAWTASTISIVSVCGNPGTVLSSSVLPDTLAAIVLARDRERDRAHLLPDNYAPNSRERGGDDWSLAQPRSWQLDAGGWL